jgi:hypothetical protein
MSSSSNSHRTNARDSSYYHQHQSQLETISPDSSSPNGLALKSEKRLRSSTTKKKHKHHRRRSSDKDSDNNNSKSRRTTSTHRSSPSKQHSRYESSSNRYYHNRHTFDTSSKNQTDSESVNKKRKPHYTDDHHSSKKHRRSSPATIYSSHHRSRNSTHRRRSSSSSLSPRSNEIHQHAPSNQYDSNQTGKLTKGTLGSELDKLRPKTNKNKTITTAEMNENDVRTNVALITTRIDAFQTVQHKPVHPKL